MTAPVKLLTWTTARPETIRVLVPTGGLDVSTIVLTLLDDEVTSQVTIGTIPLTYGGLINCCGGWPGGGA